VVKQRERQTSWSFDLACPTLGARTLHSPFNQHNRIMASPKRKSDSQDDDAAASIKKPRLDADTGIEQGEADTSTTQDSVPPDSRINHTDAIAYWSGTEASVSGVLGGFPQVSRVDLQGSRNFLAKLRRGSKTHPASKKLSRVVDCGAGIGRVTTGFLSKVAETVDIVEPVVSFTDQIKAGEDNVGQIYNVGLESFFPDKDGLVYDLVWNQWCVGQLTDAQLVAYLKRLPKALAPGGWIVVKENLSNHHLDQDVFDETDSSVTRTDENFRRLFEEAGLRVVATELQKGMPKDLYAVRSYALQPS
jgi:protein N-terminal methyltransferase